MEQSTRFCEVIGMKSFVDCSQEELLLGMSQDSARASLEVYTRWLGFR